MKVDTSYIQFFSTEIEGDGKPVDLEVTLKDSNGRLVKNMVIYNVYCNLEFIGNQQVQVEYWNPKEKGVLVANSIEEIKVNGESLEPCNNKQ